MSTTKPAKNPKSQKKKPAAAKARPASRGTARLAEIEAYWKKQEQIEGAKSRSRSRGTGAALVAEGDSWFDFKIAPDVIDWLERDHGYKIFNYAKAGACVYEMAYGTDAKWFDRDPTQLEVVVKAIQTARPQALLLSGAGNDFAGPEFILTIHHALANPTGVNLGVLDALVKTEIEPGFRVMIETYQAAARAAGLVKMPILLHGYDYPFPDGRKAVDVGFGLISIGPWMHDSFQLKGYPFKNDADLRARQLLVKIHIDALYAMLARLSADYADVHFVDVRGALPKRGDWHDEMHPTKAGFRTVAALFAAQLQALGV